MDKQSLVELHSFVAKGRDNKKLRPGVLIHVNGPAGIVESENRNKRIYTKGLWEKVLRSQDLKERFDRRSLLGEADHPESFDSSIPRVSHIVTSMKVDENAIYAGFDIVDTPNGRIVNTLLDAGVELGVSTRGRGALEQRGTKNFVTEDAYEFSTIDFVIHPSGQNAYPKPVTEAFSQAAQNAPTRVAVYEALQRAGVPESSIKGLMRDDDSVKALMQALDEAHHRALDAAIEADIYKKQLIESEQAIKILVSQPSIKITDLKGNLKSTTTAINTPDASLADQFDNSDDTDLEPAVNEAKLPDNEAKRLALLRKKIYAGTNTPAEKVECDRLSKKEEALKKVSDPKPPATTKTEAVLRAKVNELQRINESLNEKIKPLTATSSKALESLTEKLSKTEAQRDSMKNSLRTLDDSNASLKEDVDRARIVNSRLNSLNENLSKEILTLKRDLQIHSLAEEMHIPYSEIKSSITESTDLPTVRVISEAIRSKKTRRDLPNFYQPRVILETKLTNTEVKQGSPETLTSLVSRTAGLNKKKP